jgi:hypothetical protein
MHWGEVRQRVQVSRGKEEIERVSADEISIEEKRRLLALDRAIATWAERKEPVSAYGPSELDKRTPQLIKTAQEFERYLKGDGQ